MATSDPLFAEVIVLTDLYAEDLFFICSDGVTESYSDQELVELLTRDDLTDDQRIARIAKKCGRYSRDNFTACLVRLRHVSEDWREEATVGLVGYPLRKVVRTILRKINIIKD